MIEIVLKEGEPQKCGDSELTAVVGHIEISGDKRLCVLQLAAAFEQIIKGDYDGLFDKALAKALEHIEHDKK
jgi:hypothetical protein